MGGLDRFDRIARFEHLGGAVVDVLRGDVRDVRADWTILGRAPSLRASFEREWSSSFGQAPWRSPSLRPGRPTLWMQSPRDGSEPTRTAVAIDRSVRRVQWSRRDDALRLHARSLALEMQDAIASAVEARAESVALIGLSARHVDVSAIVAAAATFNALIALAVQRALLSCFACARPFASPTPGTDQSPPPRILLVDEADPTPFVDALANRGQRLVRSKLVVPMRWRRVPLRRVE